MQDLNLPKDATSLGKCCFCKLSVPDKQRLIRCTWVLRCVSQGSNVRKDSRLSASSSRYDLQEGFAGLLGKLDQQLAVKGRHLVSDCNTDLAGAYRRQLVVATGNAIKAMHQACCGDNAQKLLFWARVLQADGCQEHLHACKDLQGETKHEA